MEMNKEQGFLEKVEELAQLASGRNGRLDREDIEQAFLPDVLDEEQYAAVCEYLRGRGISTAPDENVSAEERMTEEERAYLDYYLEELESIPALSSGEREAVLLSSMAGDRDAQRRLTEDMLRDVVDIAKLYAGQDVFMEDLIGAGNEALILSVSMLAPFDGAGEAEGFLVRKIMDAMEDQVSMNLDIKAEENEAVQLVSRVAAEASKLAELIGRKISAEELERETDLDADEIARAVKLSGGQIEDLQ
ncbi:MAG: hypothetical protein IJ930_01545 [Lachnospiraceae bacterium]|nr:hypothetical protein [Lachnospiraceae bacterium]